MKHRAKETRKAELSLQRKGSHISGNLATTSQGTEAWFSLPAQPWSFRSDSDRANLIVSAAGSWAGLAGHRFHLRGTQRPYPAPAWARALHQSSPNALPGFSDYLVKTQEHLRERSTSVQEWYLGVDVRDDDFGDGLRRLWKKDGGSAEERLQHRANEIAELVAGPGLNGQPLTGEQVAWLVNRSVALGLPPQMREGSEVNEWDAEDAFMFTEQVIVESNPFGRSVRIRDVETEQQRFVVALTMGPMEQVAVPDRARGPWLAHATTRLSFPVEVSVRAEILAGREAASDVEAKLRLIRDQQSHYREHGIDEPIALEKQAQAAKQIDDDMQNGSAISGTRVHGHVRLAVWGATEAEALARAREVKASYAGRGVEIVRPKAQYALVREFIPSEPKAATGYLRRFPVIYWAAATPSISNDIGDNRGPLLARTGGVTRRGVFFDTHDAMERQDGSGLLTIVGQLGSGKSVALGEIAHDAVLRGIHSTILDPSGPLAALCDVPALAPYARHIPLTNAAPGTLNPYRVVAQPNRTRYPNTPEGNEAFELAKAAAGSQRKGLALDVLRMLLPPSLDALPDTQPALLDAIEDNGAGVDGSLWGVVERLEATEQGRQLGRFFRNVSYQPLASLMFGVGVPQYATGAGKFDNLLTVITMPGLTLPDRSISREHWTNEERMAVPLLHLATFYTSRAIYDRPRHERKFVGLDEMRQLSDWAAGRSLFVRLATDSRKYNTRVVASSQDPEHILGMGNVKNLVGSVLVGRVNDTKTAGDCCDLLGIPRNDGFEQTLMALSTPNGDTPPPYRDFAMRDSRGRVEVITIDLAHRPELLAALNTRATGIAVPV